MFKFVSSLAEHSTIENKIHLLLCFFQIEQKRKKQKKDGRLAEGIPEDDPIKYKHAIYVMTMKVKFPFFTALS